MIRFKILSINTMGQVSENDDLNRAWDSLPDALDELCNYEGWRPSFTISFGTTTDLYLIQNFETDGRNKAPRIVYEE